MMKQSRLAFSSQAGSSTSHIGLADAIVIDHSDDDDGFATPPLTPPLPSPGPLQPANQDNYISSGTHAVISSSNLGKRPIKRPRDEHSTLLAQGVASGVMGKRPLSAASEGRLPSDLVSGLPIDAASSESKMCHQHRHTCLPLLQCTRLKEEGKRCPMKYCYWTLQRMYKQDAEQIIRAGRNVLGVDVKEHVGPDEASYLWKCPKCRGKCQCSLCRKRAGLEPLGPIKDGSLSLADTDKAPMRGSTVKKSDSSSKEIPAKKKPNVDKANVEVKRTLLADGFARASQMEHQPAKVTVDRPKAALQQQTLQKPLKEPAAVDKPELTAVSSRLPVANLKERIWLYECLVRFDSLGIGKAVLQRLDRFDDWTEWQVQQILESLLCRVAGVSSMKTKTPRKVHQKLLDVFLDTGKDLARGEVWSTAKSYCESKDVRIADLVPVAIQPHQVGLGADAARRTARALPAETLLQGRVTRSRRAAETRALERVKALSKQENNGSDEEEESDLSEEEDEEESESLSNTSDEEEEPARRRSTRQMAKQTLRKRETESSDEESEKETSPMSSRVDERDEKMDQEDSVEVEDEKPLLPLDAPPFESRIAILSGLMEILLQSKSLNEELTRGSKQAVLLERESREEEKELMTEQAAEAHAHNAKAPSMAITDEFAAWKEEKQALSRKHAYALLDLRVHTQLLVEAHKTRSGPLGVDSDGNEYWHLSEYVEKKPADVAGHWAWSLFVLGSHFYKEPVVEAQQREEGANSASPKEEKRAEPRDDDLEDSTDEDSVIVLIEVPAKYATSSSKEKAKRKVEKDDCKRDLKTPPPPQATTVGTRATEEEEEKKVVGFSSTSDEHEIAQLKAYIQFRLALREYEENMQARGVEEASKAEALHNSISKQIDKYEGGATGSSDLIGYAAAACSNVHERATSSAADRKRWKADLHEKQTQRRQQVEKLLKNLETVRMYHQWHAEDA